MSVWWVLSWMSSGAALAAPDPGAVLTACGHSDLAASFDGTAAKIRNKAIFDAAKVHVEAQEYVCSATLTHLVLATGEPRKADVRRLQEMLAVVQELGFTREAQPALNEGRFDEAESLFSRLAATGHARSAKVAAGWSTFNQRRWLHERARDALQAGAPREAQRLLAQLLADPEREDLSPDRPWSAVETLQESIDAAVAADDELAAQEARDGVECWTTLAGEPSAIREVGGCPDGVSERLRTRHAAAVRAAREAFGSGPVHVTTAGG